MLWLYLHFPHLLLDHLQRSRKERSAMVVITESGQHVQQACARARELGIEPGLRLKTALSLASELATVQADPERERLILTQQAR
ncbi:MAG: DNA polymerase Y family protein, partial [Marinobacter sp.]|nr:DNA polymerase Y family protein [Marinobacter sp.]